VHRRDPATHPATRKRAAEVRVHVVSMRVANDLRAVAAQRAPAAARIQFRALRSLTGDY
jgi:hypothetical protein